MSDWPFIFTTTSTFTNHTYNLGTALSAAELKKLLDDSKLWWKDFSVIRPKSENKILSLRDQDKMAGLVPLSPVKEFEKKQHKPFPSRALRNFEPGVNPLMPPLW